MFSRGAKLHLRKRYKYPKKGRKKFIGYAVEFYDPTRHPIRKWVSLGTKDKTSAMNKFAEMDQAYARGEYDPWRQRLPQHGVTFDDAVKAYVKARRKQASSVRNDESVLGALGRRLPPALPVAHVSPAHVRGYIESLQVKDSTLYTYYRRLHAFFSWAKKRQLLRDHPMADMTPPEVGKKAPRFLSRGEYDLLIKTIEEDAEKKRSGQVHRTSLKDGEVVWLIDVVRFAVGTGLRISELCNLRWSGVDLYERFITVQNYGGYRTKSGHERRVPIAGEALAVLRRLKEADQPEETDFVFKGTGGEKLNATYVSKRFKDYVTEAKLPSDVHFHTLRHTYASWLVMQGVSIYDVMELLGHASIEMTMRYAHLAPDRLRAGVEATFGAPGKKRSRGMAMSNRRRRAAGRRRLSERSSSTATAPVHRITDTLGAAGVPDPGATKVLQNAATRRGLVHLGAKCETPQIGRTG